MQPPTSNKKAKFQYIYIGIGCQMMYARASCRRMNGGTCRSSDSGVIPNRIWFTYSIEYITKTLRQVL